MRIKFIQKKGLSILFASCLFTACLFPKEEPKGVEYNSYTDHIKDSHLLIRDKIKQMKDSMPYLTDSSAFGMRLFPLIEALEIHDTEGEIKPISHADSLVFGAHRQLTDNYRQIVMEDFRVLFDIFAKDKPNELKVNEINERIKADDALALKYFQKYLNDTTDIPLL